MSSTLHVSQLRKWFLYSPPVEWMIQNLRELLIGALRQGPIPQHVAFVMDGNRRFARTHKIETVEGHNLGFEALARVCGDDVIIETILTLKVDPRSMLQVWSQGCHYLCIQY